MDISRRVEALLNLWCERRSLRALRWALQGWPLSAGLTDEWASLLLALQNVRVFAREELTATELRSVDELVSDVQQIVYRN